MKKIYGVKMFQVELNNIRLHREYIDSPNPLDAQSHTASSLSCYILLHFACDSFGRIAAEDFNLKRLAKKHNLPYSSIHKGFHRLLRSGFLRIQWIEEKEYYAISGYDKANTAKELNYFLLPNDLLRSNVLADLISARDVNGIIGLLEICNVLSREYQRKGEENAKSITRHINKLLQTMKKTTRNIMDWVKRVQAFFVIDVKKKESIAKSTLSIDLPETCFRDNEIPTEQLQVRAKMRKEIEYALTHLPRFIKTADIDSIKNNFIYNVADVFHHADPKGSGVALRLAEIVHEAADFTRTAIENGHAVIYNPAGFWFTRCQELAYDWYQELQQTPGLDSLFRLKAGLMRNKKDLPSYLQK